MTQVQFWPSTRRGQPSPSGRGQGEGSDVTFTLAVFWTGASNSGNSLAALSNERNEVRVDLGEVRCLHRDGFLAPSPITAKEESTSDPSPCPLPVGEGSLCAHSYFCNTRIETLGFTRSSPRKSSRHDKNPRVSSTEIAEVTEKRKGLKYIFERREETAG
jgi:hypothetical protein